MESRAVAILPAQLHAVHQDIVHLALIHVAHELRKIDFFVLLPAAAGLNHLPQQQRG